VPGLLAAAVAAVPPIVLLAITHLTVILTRTPDDETPAGASPQAPAIAVRQVPAPDTGPALTPAAVPPELRSSEQPQELGQASSENERTEDEQAADGSSSGRRKQARMLREAGWSNKRIARHLGVHASTVGRWFALAHPTDGTESDTAGDEP
jgi:DNA-binding NarL/FixJ family response regulator